MSSHLIIKSWLCSTEDVEEHTQIKSRRFIWCHLTLGMKWQKKQNKSEPTQNNQSQMVPNRTRKTAVDTQLCEIWCTLHCLLLPKGHARHTYLTSLTTANNSGSNQKNVVSVFCTFPFVSFCFFLQCSMFFLPFSLVIKTIPLAKQLAARPASPRGGINIYMLTDSLNKSQYG